MRNWLIFLAALLLSGPAALQAQPAGNDPAVLRMRAADAVAVMQQLRSAGDVFNSAFLAEVSEARLAGVVSQLEAQYGKLLGPENLVVTRPGAATMTLVFERARASTILVVEPSPPRRISGLRITSITAQGNIAPITPLTTPTAPVGSAPPPASPSAPPLATLFGVFANLSSSAPASAPPPAVSPASSLAAEFAALPGVAGFSIARLDFAGPQVIQSQRGDQPLAIGSAFKLWVLDALAEEVAQGRINWSQMVPIGPPSLPSGVSQDWAPGTQASIEKLATLMISISDNTATDTLIRLIGRDKVEARLLRTGHSRPDLMHPLLLTSEVSNLKLGPQWARDAYARADGSARTQILAGMKQGVDPALLGNLAAYASGPPVAIDSIEWFASSNDLVRVLDALRQRSDPMVKQILGSSAGMSPEFRNTFAFAGYKGGSEPGVLSLNWLLQRPSGTWYAISANWVNKTAQLDTSRMEVLAQKLLAAAP